MLTALCALDAKLNPFTPDEVHADVGSYYRKPQQLPKSTGQPTAATEERSGYRMFGSRCNSR